MHLNCETHDTNWVKAMLAAWRVLRPTRVTLWTMEGNQFNLFSSIATEIVASNVFVGPQAYLGDMTRIESAHEVDGWARIVPFSRIRPFLDAAQLGKWWEGVAYTQGRFP